MYNADLLSCLITAVTANRQHSHAYIHSSRGCVVSVKDSDCRKACQSCVWRTSLHIAAASAMHCCLFDCLVIAWIDLQPHMSLHSKVTMRVLKYSAFELGSIWVLCALLPQGVQGAHCTRCFRVKYQVAFAFILWVFKGHQNGIASILFFTFAAGALIQHGHTTSLQI